MTEDFKPWQQTMVPCMWLVRQLDGTEQVARSREQVAALAGKGAAVKPLYDDAAVNAFFTSERIVERALIETLFGARNDRHTMAEFCEGARILFGDTAINNVIVRWRHLASATPTVTLTEEVK